MASATRARIAWYGADTQDGVEYLRMGQEGMSFRWKGHGVRARLWGYHNLLNSLAAMTAAECLGIDRKEQDAWAARSHKRANAGWESGALAEEVVRVEVPQRTGPPVALERDEGVRADSTPESLARLKPAFAEAGTITAGNASQISDGAAALVVASPEKAEQLGLEPLAEIVAHGMSAERFPYLHTVPAIALQNALKKADLDVHDLGLLEVNEAFAAIALHVTRILGFDEELVNVNGGAVALGHPIGASGGRIVTTMIHELRRSGGGLGLAAICSGGGQGDALLIEV